MGKMRTGPIKGKICMAESEYEKSLARKRAESMKMFGIYYNETKSTTVCKFCHKYVSWVQSVSIRSHVISMEHMNNAEKLIATTTTAVSNVRKFMITKENFKSINKSKEPSKMLQDALIPKQNMTTQQNSANKFPPKHNVVSKKFPKQNPANKVPLKHNVVSKVAPKQNVVSKETTKQNLTNKPTPMENVMSTQKQLVKKQTPKNVIINQQKSGKCATVTKENVESKEIPRKQVVTTLNDKEKQAIPAKEKSHDSDDIMITDVCGGIPETIPAKKKSDDIIITDVRGGIQEHETEDESYNLRWIKNNENIRRFYAELLTSEKYSDVSLACEGHIVKAHKVVLAASSTYFENIFEDMSIGGRPVIMMPSDLKYSQLLNLLHFIYNGEITLPSYDKEIANFLKFADHFQLKGFKTKNL